MFEAKKLDVWTVYVFANLVTYIQPTFDQLLYLLTWVLCRIFEQSLDGREQCSLIVRVDTCEHAQKLTAHLYCWVDGFLWTIITIITDYIIFYSNTSSCIMLYNLYLPYSVVLYCIMSEWIFLLKCSCSLQILFWIINFQKIPITWYLQTILNYYKIQCSTDFIF